MAVPTTTAARTPSAAPVLPDLRAQLLKLADLPAGWTVHQQSLMHTQGADECIRAAVDLQWEADDRAEVTFRYGPGGLPSLAENVGYSLKLTKAAMAAAIETLDACRKISNKERGMSFDAELLAVSFPVIGDESRAYQLTTHTVFHTHLTTTVTDLLVFRVGDELAFLAYVTGGSPEVLGFQRIAAKAAAEIAGLSVNLS